MEPKKETEVTTEMKQGELNNQERPSPGMSFKDMASVAHEANRRYCQTQGDFSQLSWDEAPEWQRDSARKGVTHVYLNPDGTPEDSHKSWMREKLKQGWKYGPVKDAELKEHPCLVPYEDLPANQRIKDALFIAVVKVLLGTRARNDETC